MLRDEHDSKQLRTALVITSERLENETRRADEAERRIMEVLHRLQGAHEATMLAQADMARANEEVRLYKLRLDEAQREIFRAQEIVDQISKEKDEAEAEAARARSTARKFREQSLVARARDEGRRQGFQEGMIRGREFAQLEQSARRAYDPERSQRRPIFNDEPLVEEGDEEEEEAEEEEEEEARPESPPIIHVRSPRAESMQSMPSMQPAQAMQQPSWRPPSRYVVRLVGLL